MEKIKVLNEIIDIIDNKINNIPKTVMNYEEMQYFRKKVQENKKIDLRTLSRYSEQCSNDDLKLNLKWLKTELEELRETEAKNIKDLIMDVFKTNEESEK